MVVVLGPEEMKVTAAVRSSHGESRSRLPPGDRRSGGTSAAAENIPNVLQEVFTCRNVEILVIR